MASNDASLRVKLTTYRTSFWALLIALLGLGFLLLRSFVSWFDHHDSLAAVVNELGGLLITTGGLAVLWDLRGKRDLIDEVLAKARIPFDVREVGLTQVTMNWLAIPWETLFKSSRNIEVHISYGSSWRNTHWERLKDFSSEKSHSLKIYLPDPGDESTMKVLAQRY